MQVANYLFGKQQRDSSLVKDAYIQVAAAGVGLAAGAGGIAYAVKNVTSYVNEENAQHCANLTMAMLEEVQRQIQLFNASCIVVDPGSAMSVCNTALLPKPVNTSCPDVAGGTALNYLPALFIGVGIATFSLLIGHSILSCYPQRKVPQDAETWRLASSGENWQKLLPSDDSESAIELLL